MKKNNTSMDESMRKIEALSDFEHIRLRPTIFVGSCKPQTEKIIIFDKENQTLKYKVVEYTKGFYRLFDEILDNAIDEVKRCIKEDYKPGPIVVKIFSKKNMVEISDSGRGFLEPDKINPKTGLHNVDTALSKLRSGSNFKNENFEASIVGQNGIGSGAVNMLSDFFQVDTCDGEVSYQQEWNNFVPMEPLIQKINNKTGTTIRFIPSTQIFGNKLKWDFDVIYTNLIFKNFLFKNNENFKNVPIYFFWDDIEFNLDVPVLPKDAIRLKLNKRCSIHIWEKKSDDDAKISFVNSSLCTGFHQQWIEEFINEKIFGVEFAAKFYNTSIIMDLKPKDVQFQEQIKIRLDISRHKLEQIIPLEMGRNDLSNFKKTDLFKQISQRIKEYENSFLIKKIKTNKTKRIVSDKFFDSKHKENLFICEGLSALGSLNQKRDANTDSVFALTGKIKNTEKLEDLANSKVIANLLSILGLNLENKGSVCKYKRIIIATDRDEDGTDIAGLILVLFHRWFPEIIKLGKLFWLLVPLASYDVNNATKYLYSLSEMLEIPPNAKNKRYLKGLGSLSVKDWENVFKNMNLFKFGYDQTSEKFIEMAFNSNSILRRKLWLSK